MKSDLRPVIFLDIDDVLVLTASGWDAERLHGIVQAGADLALEAELIQQISDRNACENLLRLLIDFNLRVVVSSSWRSACSREQFEAIFTAAGLQEVVTLLADPWCTPLRDSATTRLQEIISWPGELSVFVILDDLFSGSSLEGHPCAVLCDDKGFDAEALKRAIEILEKQLES